MGDVKWITKNGVHIPITNEYMNEKIRKEYTKKDIKISRLGKEYKNRVDSYELNGWYLIKDYGEGVRNNTWYEWAISKSKFGYADYISKRKAMNEGNYFYVDSYKDGINKLIEVANDKRS